jgi:hypothetical protein
VGLMFVDVGLHRSCAALLRPAYQCLCSDELQCFLTHRPCRSPPTHCLGLADPEPASLRWRKRWQGYGQPPGTRLKASGKAVHCRAPSSISRRLTMPIGGSRRMAKGVMHRARAAQRVCLKCRQGQSVVRKAFPRAEATGARETAACNPPPSPPVPVGAPRGLRGARQRRVLPGLAAQQWRTTAQGTALVARQGGRV